MSVIERPVEVEIVVDNEVSKVLERAADLLVERGWCQGSTFQPDGFMCARGAILLATTNLDQRLHDLAEDRLAEFVGYESVIVWNDSPVRTQAEVVRKMKEAAAAVAAE